MTSYRPHPKGARTNPSSPNAWATDDRTGFIVNHRNLIWQQEWAGNSLINKGLLVRPQSLDQPQSQFRTVLIPPDPAPLFNARIEPYSIDEEGPLNTTLTQTSAAFTSVVFVDGVDGFFVGNFVYVQTSLGFDYNEIAAIDALTNSITLMVPLSATAIINGSFTLAVGVAARTRVTQAVDVRVAQDGDTRVTISG